MTIAESVVFEALVAIADGTFATWSFDRLGRLTKAMGEAGRDGIASAAATHSIFAAEMCCRAH